jgi:hypothetical protein
MYYTDDTPPCVCVWRGISLVEMYMGGAPTESDKLPSWLVWPYMYYYYY